MISAGMPEIIIQNIFSGIGSVIFTEINYPKHFFRSVYVLWAMVSCGFLRESAFPTCFVSGKRRESAKISENLRLGSVCPLRSVPLNAP